MRIPKRLGSILLAIWLILWGLTSLFDFSFNGLDIVMGVLALAAGALLLLSR